MDYSIEIKKTIGSGEDKRFIGSYTEGAITESFNQSLSSIGSQIAQLTSRLEKLNRIKETMEAE